MPKQLTFELPTKPALGRDAFFVSPSNALAVKQLENWQNWPQRMMVLVGPKGSGKTHLAHVWAEKADAKIINAATVTSENAPEQAQKEHVVIEDFEQVLGVPEREQAIFHFYNLMQSSSGSVLFTASRAPSHLDFQIRDLQSRMRALAIVALEEPDDRLLAAMLIKLFADRQINVGPELVPYLISRIDRSAFAVQSIVALLDDAALEKNRNVTRRLAAEVLDKL